MKNYLIYVIVCVTLVACKKETPEKPVVTVPEPIEVKIKEIDSTAIKDSIARVDSIAKSKIVKKKPAPVRKKKKKVEILDKNESPYKSLIFNVQLGINPKRKNWVLFKNGTYVIFPDGYTKDQMKNAAIKLVKSFNNNPLTVKKSSFAKGWNISTSIGVYNYVSKNQLGRGITDKQKVNAKGRENILKDKSQAQVIHINTK